MSKRKVKAKKSNREITAGYYVVAFIDLLGQQGHLREMKGIPDETKQQEMQDFVKALKNTYGVVKGMRKAFSNFFDGFSKESPNVSRRSPFQQRIYNQLSSEPIQCQTFSDSVIVYLPIRTDRFKVPCSGIFGVLGASASTLIYSLASGHPVRGGIDLGVGLEITRGDIYGSALARAHALESQKASFPRIVVGSELVTYLTHTAHLKTTDDFSQVNRDAAQICLDLLDTDKDGCVFVDFLGDGCKEHLIDVISPEIVDLCYSFVCNELTRHAHENNEKLLPRYQTLKQYLESRLSLWL
jgi:hypothetical protein